jgi:MFS family permease
LAPLDSQFFVRLVLPWLPLFVLFQVNRLHSSVPEILGSATMVLAARVLVDANFRGVVAGIFGLLPLVMSVLLTAGVVENWNWAWTYYVMAAVGTVLAVLSEAHNRR